MDTTTDIRLIKVDEYGNPMNVDNAYSLTSFLDDIKSGKADLRFSIGLCEKDEKGETKWISPNKIWVIYEGKTYTRQYGWVNNSVYYKGLTKRNYKEINALLGYCAIDSHNTYL